MAAISKNLTLDIVTIPEKFSPDYDVSRCIDQSAVGSGQKSGTASWLLTRDRQKCFQGKLTSERQNCVQGKLTSRHARICLAYMCILLVCIHEKSIQQNYYAFHMVNPLLLFVIVLDLLCVMHILEEIKVCMRMCMGTYVWVSMHKYAICVFMQVDFIMRTCAY